MLVVYDVFVNSVGSVCFAWLGTVVKTGRDSDFVKLSVWHGIVRMDGSCLYILSDQRFFPPTRSCLRFYQTIYNGCIKNERTLESPQAPPETPRGT